MARHVGAETLRNERSQPMKESINVRLLTALLEHYPAISSFNLHRVAPSAARRFRGMKEGLVLEYEYDHSTHKYDYSDTSKTGLRKLLERERGS